MKKEHYLGLDIGTNSVGYAVTDKAYNVQSFNKKDMWGSHVFESANQATERRGHRSARRRLYRKKQRVQLTRELLAKEIAKVDEEFYLRLDESALLKEDMLLQGSNSLFNDKMFTDEDYYEKYPTIHHLIMDLISAKDKKDIRLIYLAVSYLVANRGHFLIEVEKDEINKVISFETVYERFINYFTQNEIESNWTNSIEGEIAVILKDEKGIRNKQNKMKQLILNGRRKVNKTEDTVIKAISGGKFKLVDLFEKPGYAEIEHNNLSLGIGDFGEILDVLKNDIEDHELELIIVMKSLYDWALLSKVLKGKRYISEGKISQYNKHKVDLQTLKYFVKKYIPRKYNEVFRHSKNKLNNYVAYSGNFKSAKLLDNREKWYRTNNLEFCKYLRSLFDKIKVDENDIERFRDMKLRIGTEFNNEFMPKQVSKLNSVIPYQLTRYQLKEILNNVAEHHPFLLERNEEDLCVIDKLLSIIEFKIPYYVGPLNDYHAKDKIAWIKRKSEGKILPWNFEEKVDLEASEEAFIRKMTGKCTYLAGADVLYKNSLLYSKYMVLNSINNIKINEEKITVECKQQIYNELFVNKRQKIKKSNLQNWLISNNFMTMDQEVRGIDDEIPATLGSYHDFKRLLHSQTLTNQEVEKIIARISLTTDKKRLIKHLKDNYSQLTKEDIRYISNLRFKDYGRLSKELLTEIEGVIPETGEITNLIQALWDTNYNLMELLSERFYFMKEINKKDKIYYENNPQTIGELLDEMYISNAVKRPIYRTIDIVKEIRGIMNIDPKKVFIEMARGPEENKRRIKSRKDQLLEMYQELGEEYKKVWGEKLQREPDGKLKSNRFFLYYMQLGKCMYTDVDIVLDELTSKRYDIDHIYPQSKVKDESIHNNKVLVDSDANNTKSDIYPIKPEVQSKMMKHWNVLLKRKLITKEKYFRLTRTTRFKDDELAGFINRQLVETRQSTKAVANVLKILLPETEIVYVKAGLISDFRHQFDLLKTREINDLHHAKDAYLNIIIGNVFHVKFTSNPLNFIKRNEKYSLKIKGRGGILSQDIERSGVVAWKADETIRQVKNTMQKNNVNYVRYAFCRNGGLFNQNPEKASDKSGSLIPRKAGLSPRHYGGYNDTTASFFTLVKHVEKGKACISIKPVDLIYAEQFIEDDAFALEYCKRRLGLESPKFLLNRKVLKINTLLSIDGFRANIASKSNGGKTIVLSSSIPLVLSVQQERYVQRLESVVGKAKRRNVDIIINEQFDKINKKENEELYDALLEKCNANIFQRLSVFIKLYETLDAGKELFLELSIEEQVNVLLNIVKVFKTGRTTGCNLKVIGGKAKGSVLTINSKVSSIKHQTLNVIDQSATGLFEKKSGNLLEL